MKLALAALAACCLPAIASAAVFRDAASSCQVTTPDTWTVHPGRSVAPTAGFYARVRSVPDTGAMRAQLQAQGATIVYDTPARLLATMQVAGNRLYWSVSKTHPACWATVTFPAAMDAQARPIAESVRP